MTERQSKRAAAGSADVAGVGVAQQVSDAVVDQWARLGMT
jgi:hypothetical protein